MTEFEIPDYYNQSKPKPDKEEVLIERKCNMCHKKIMMHKFQRFCNHCKIMINNNYNGYGGL